MAHATHFLIVLHGPYFCFICKGFHPVAEFNPPSDNLRPVMLFRLVAGYHSDVTQ
jgi:hypothetical protein